MFRFRPAKSVALLALLFLAAATSAFSAEVRPEINGSMDAACRINNSCVFMGSGSNQSGAIPNNIYNALIANARGTSHIKIKDVAVMDSAGIGILINDYSDHIVVENVEVGYTAMLGLDVRPNTSQLLIRDSSFHHSAICSFWHRGDGQVNDPEAPDACERNFPSTVELGGLDESQGATHIVFMNNDVYQGFGEGVGVYGSDTVWIVGNRVRGHRTSEILNDNSHFTLIESNICWDYDASNDATMGKSYWGTSADFGTRCLVVTLEPLSFAQDTVNNIIRNNISASSSCLVMSNAPVINGTTQQEFVIGAQWYGNTCIGYTSVGAALDNGTDDPTYSRELQLVNNIFYSNSTNAKDCGAFPKSSYDANRVGPNYFGSQPADTDCSSDNGAYPDIIGKPDLARDADTWGESYWTASRGPTYEDAILLPGDAGLDAGRPLQNPVPFLNAINWDYFGEVNSPCIGGLAASQWEMANAYDFNCTLRSASSPNIGADESN